MEVWKDALMLDKPSSTAFYLRDLGQGLSFPIYEMTTVLTSQGCHDGQI